MVQGQGGDHDRLALSKQRLAMFIMLMCHHAGLEHIGDNIGIGELGALSNTCGAACVLQNYGVVWLIEMGWGKPLAQMLFEHFSK